MLKDERERRGASRLPVEFEVAVRHLGRPEETHADLARNIGAGGVFIETSVGVPLGSPVAIEIDLDGRPVTLEGEVIRVEWRTTRSGSRVERRARGMAVTFRPGQSAIEPLLARLAELAEREGEERQER